LNFRPGSNPEQGAGFLMPKANRVLSTPRRTASKKQVRKTVSEEIQLLKERNDLYLKIEPLLHDACRAAEIAVDAIIDDKEYATFAVCQASIIVRDLREVFYGRPPFPKEGAR
jgi:hypothetical protein